jgi:ATPase subunit of ABC transporter with duplicated ATPase domains
MGKSGMDGVLPSKRKPKKKDKKKDKKKAAGADAKGRKNKKAFNVANVVSAKRTMQRNLDKAQQKEVVPLTSRDEAEPPPALVVVMGPKGCGKSTLIRSLVSFFVLLICVLSTNHLQSTSGQDLHWSKSD